LSFAQDDSFRLCLRIHPSLAQDIRSCLCLCIRCVLGDNPGMTLGKRLSIILHSFGPISSLYVAEASHCLGNINEM
jgi:hypothetical protein